jgi:hypothetical protein
MIHTYAEKDKELEDWKAYRDEVVRENIHLCTALAEKDKELKSWRDSRDGVMSHVEEMQAEITRLKGLLAEAVAALETILFLSDAPSCHAVARTILGLEKIGESHEKG